MTNPKSSETTKEEEARKSHENYIRTLEANNQIYYGDGPLPTGYTFRGTIDPKTGKKSIRRERFS